MAGISDSGNPDDIRVHLDLLITADASRRAEVPGESAREKLARESVLLTAVLEERVKAALADISGAVPAPDNPESKKILNKRGDATLPASCG